MKIEGYKLPKEILPDPKATRDSTSGLLEIKFIEQAAQANKPPTLNIDSIIRHGENKRVWVPLESKQPDDMLNEALKNGKIGKLIATILWFGENNLLNLVELMNPEYTFCIPSMASCLFSEARANTTILNW